MSKVRTSIVSGSLGGLALGFLMILGGCDGAGSGKPAITKEDMASQQAATEANIAAQKAKGKAK